MTQANTQATQPLSTSRFYMWRCVIALAHADGHFSSYERTYLEKVLKGIARTNVVSAEQSATFAADMDRPQKVSDLLRHINEPAVRGELVYFGGLLARADGTLSPSEAEILKKLRADQMDSADMEQLRKDVAINVTDSMFQHDLKKAELRPEGKLSSALDSFLLRMGIDIQ